MVNDKLRPNQLNKYLKSLKNNRLDMYWEGKDRDHINNTISICDDSTLLHVISWSSKGNIEKIINSSDVNNKARIYIVGNSDVKNMIMSRSDARLVKNEIAIIEDNKYKERTLIGELSMLNESRLKKQLDAIKKEIKLSEEKYKNDEQYYKKMIERARSELAKLENDKVNLYNENDERRKVFDAEHVKNINAFDLVIESKKNEIKDLDAQIQRRIHEDQEEWRKTEIRLMNQEDLFREKEVNLQKKLDDIKSKIELDGLNLAEIQNSIRENSQKQHDQMQEYNTERAKITEEISKLKSDQEAYRRKLAETKVPEFVNSAVQALGKQRRLLHLMHTRWNRYGVLAFCGALVVALISFIYGCIHFSSITPGQTTWMYLVFFVAKGLIIVTLLGAWAKHAYNNASAHMHESLKRSDRIHAINFGKLYFEVYGQNASQSDMKSIFENWNINNETAFSKSPAPDFDPKTLDILLKMFESASNAAKSIANKDK